MTVRPLSPVVEVTPVYSGDTAAVGELAEETPTEWTDRAGEKDPGEGEVGVVSVSVKSSSLSAESVEGRQVNATVISCKIQLQYSTTHIQNII